MMNTKLSIRDVFSLWFSLKGRVSRRAYLLSGFGLMALKFLSDTLLVRLGTGQRWTPLDYLSPRLMSEWDNYASGNQWVLVVLLIWSLPFVWVGASMTVRRGLDAGFAGATGLLFFLPVINYFWMLSLCFFPTAEAAEPAPSNAVPAKSTFAALFQAAWPATALGAAVAVTSIFISGVYGAVMFLGVPFAMGFTAAYRARRLGITRTSTTIWAGQLSILLAGGVFLLSALEGLVCLIMAAPPAILLAVLGSLVGGSAARRPAASAAQVLLVFASLPLLLGAEAVDRPPPLREVVSIIEIDAPPEVVWQNVVGFTELPPPSRLVFELGISHPRRARIEGHGVGAVRYCEFSTGPFVEPITAWEEPTRLSFDVRDQPEPMHEWSPYQVVHAPHLLESLRSRRGEFRLIRLAGGRTRLEGSTWYTLDMAPAWYWALWSDALIHSIHERVLEHVQTLSEMNGT